MRSCWRTLAPFRAFSCLNKGNAMPDPRPDDRKIENENQKPDRLRSDRNGPRHRPAEPLDPDPPGATPSPNGKTAPGAIRGPHHC
ncbi:hypothetical protein D3C85_1331240 [compost metagenome]